MKKIIILQTIFLSIALFVLATLGGFIWVGGLLLGAIPFLYAKKYEKKEFLKINILSSSIAFIVLVIIWGIFSFLIKGFGPEGQVLGLIVSIFHPSNMLVPGLLSALLFNLPFLVYFLFGKNKSVAQVDQKPKNESQ